MKHTPKDGGPAFPLLDSSIGWNANIEQLERGLTLRDWFMGQAAPLTLELPCHAVESLVGRPYGDTDFGSTAHWRFWAEAEAAWKALQADAMLAERKRRQ